MNQVKLRGNRVAIEKNKKADKSTNQFMVLPDSEEFLGIIRHVGESVSTDLKVGQKVYFSTNHQRSRISGVELCIMEDKEVYAIVE